MGKNVFASPLFDSTFKLVFGQKSHKQVTIDFLNDLLERTGKSNAIQDITFIHQELAPRRFDDKKSILDINCIDANKNHFIIEIQRRSEDYFDWRLFYYAASLLSRQLQETEPYSKLKPVIILGILNFKLYCDSDEPISHHKMCDMRTGKQSVNLIELHIVELGKFNKKVDQLVSHIDKWLFFLKSAHNQVAIPAVYNDTPSIRKAFDVIARLHWTQEQIDAYEKEAMLFRIEITQELAEEKKRNAKKEEGLEEGLKKGKIEGKIEGRIEGEKKAKQETALNLLAMEMPIEMIVKATGLTLQEIEALQG